LASSYERPDAPELARVEDLVRALAEEVTAWRKRCQRAEAELAEVKSRGGTLAGPELLQVRQRIVDLEGENQDLRRRITEARTRLATLRGRLVFLEDREVQSR
jgi:predicted  nucleic acid-binding Zn-ribbon protein